MGVDNIKTKQTGWSYATCVLPYSAVRLAPVCQWPQQSAARVPSVIVDLWGQVESQVQGSSQVLRSVSRSVGGSGRACGELMPWAQQPSATAAAVEALGVRKFVQAWHMTSGPRTRRRCLLCAVLLVPTLASPPTLTHLGSSRLLGHLLGGGSLLLGSRLLLRGGLLLGLLSLQGGGATGRKETSSVYISNELPSR